jgi:Fic family protein
LIKNNLASLAHFINAIGISYSNSIEKILREIDALKSEIDQFRQNDNFRIAQALELEYTFDSNRIEGNTLTLQETDLVINEGLTISEKSMREHLEAINHNDAIDYMKQLVQNKIKFSERELLDLHNLILRGIMPKDAGVYRKVQVMIKGSAHTPPQPLVVYDNTTYTYKTVQSTRSFSSILLQKIVP